MLRHQIHIHIISRTVYGTEPHRWAQRRDGGWETDGWVRRGSYVQERGITKGTKDTLGIVDVLIILIVVMVS